MKYTRGIVWHQVAQAIGALVAFSFLGITYYSRAKYWHVGTYSGIIRKEDAHVDAFDTTGMTRLMKAADALDPDRVRVCLQQGANPNLLSRDFDFQVDIHSTTQRQYSPLHYAILRGSFNKSFDVVRLLLENGADPHLRDFHGNTPLHLVFSTVDWFYQEQLFELLVQYGADPNAQNDKGNTFFHEAIENSNAGFIRPIRQKYNSIVNVELQNNRGFTPYAYAKFLGVIDAADQELNRLYREQGVIVGGYNGTDSAAVDAMGNTALMLAVIRGGNAGYERAERLLAHGASMRARINPLDKPALQGNTVLFVAILQQKPDMLELLLKKSAMADLMHKNGRGNTPLHSIMGISNPGIRKQMVEALLRRGLELQGDPAAALLLNSKNAVGETPFHAAIATGDVSLVSYLLDKYRESIDVSIRNNDYKNAFEIANQLRYPEIAQLVKSNK